MYFYFLSQVMQNRTEAILSQFHNSWIETELFYDKLINYNKRYIKIREFITELKLKGEHNFSRLGLSMDRLLISRSVNNGLRMDQKFIRIEAYDNKFDVVLRDGQKTYRSYILDDLNDQRMINLLATLRDTLVD
jgi:hypothetical protein